MANSVSFLRRIVFVAGAFALGQAAVQADVKLPSVFGDHMVLQQGQRLPVWGWAEPGEAVTVAVPLAAAMLGQATSYTRPS